MLTDICISQTVEIRVRNKYLKLLSSNFVFSDASIPVYSVLVDLNYCILYALTYNTHFKLSVG